MSSAPVVEFKHINIPTRDLERSFRFYTEILGFKYVMNLGPQKIVLDAWGFDFFLEQVDELQLNPKFHMGIAEKRQRADRALLPGSGRLEDRDLYRDMRTLMTGASSCAHPGALLDASAEKMAIPSGAGIVPLPNKEELRCIDWRPCPRA